ncbi:effector binding domain-containing protein [Bacillus salitolerans]|uniref:Effector binding domain-containing protein n=1 Tax=Bacillus salitolerans TaxID=1437434 RepID=A0ABW4LWC9_9BACI
MRKDDGSIELWVGVEVNNTSFKHDECQIITIPKRLYAKLECRCFSKEQLDDRYTYLNNWIKQEGYQIDEGFTIEPNRLTSFNPFDIPADEITAFDFDLLYPIK